MPARSSVQSKLFIILSCSNSQSLISIADSQPAIVNSENAAVAYDLLSLSNCCAREYNVMTTYLFYRDVYTHVPVLMRELTIAILNQTIMVIPTIVTYKKIDTSHSHNIILLI